MLQYPTQESVAPPSWSPLCSSGIDEGYIGETKPSTSTPERRLVVAVLRRTIWDFVIYRNVPEGHAKKALAAEAAGWIWWDGEEFMTFKHVCETLDLDPINLRRRILMLKRSDLERVNYRIESDR